MRLRSLRGRRLEAAVVAVGLTAVASCNAILGIERFDAGPTGDAGMDAGLSVTQDTGRDARHDAAKDARDSGHDAGHVDAAMPDGGKSKPPECPPGSPTQISGRVMDPGKNVGLSRANVYVASAPPVVPLPDEPGGGAPPSCDTCASLSTDGYLEGVATAADGTFTLDVTPGAHTVVAQIGRWRRIATIDAAACVTTSVPDDTLRMPASRTEGDIPKMAVVVGEQESLECLLVKIGIDPSEMAPYAVGNANRVDLYSSVNAGGAGENYWNGAAAVIPPAAIALWEGDAGSGGTLDDYSVVLFACDGIAATTGSGNAATPAAQTAMVNYANAGGRVVLDHWSGETWIENASSATPEAPGTDWARPRVASWNPTAADPPDAQAGTTLDVTPDQQAMYAWLATWDTTDPAGTITSTRARAIATTVGPDSLELVSFASLGAVGSFWFNTPAASAATPGAPSCGRVVYNDMHVSSGRGGSTPDASTGAATTFPGSCASTPLTPGELALEYELFALSTCTLSVTADGGVDGGDARSADAATD